MKNIINNITFSEYTIINFSKNLKRIINMEDSYEKLKLLERKIESYSGNKKAFIYKLAVYEKNKLKKQEKKLLKEKKTRIRDKYSNDTIKSKTVSLNISLSDLEILTRDLYNSFVDSKKFKKKCKGLKIILKKFLSNWKAEHNEKLYKKYYSVYIDVCEYLTNNFSYISL